MKTETENLADLHACLEDIKTVLDLAADPKGDAGTVNRAAAQCLSTSLPRARALLLGIVMITPEVSSAPVAA